MMPNRLDLPIESYEVDHIINKTQFENGEIEQAIEIIDLAKDELGRIGCSGEIIYLNPRSNEIFLRGIRKYFAEFYGESIHKDSGEIDQVYGMPVQVVCKIPDDTIFIVVPEWHKYMDTRFIQKILIKD